MKPLDVRFSAETKDRIARLSQSYDESMSKSLVARAAMSAGLELLEAKRDTMSFEEFVIFLDRKQ